MRVLVRPTAAFVTIIGVCFSAAEAQESYRTQQSLRPMVNLTSRDRAEPPASKRTARPARFMGWKATAAQGPDVVQYFANRARRRRSPSRFSSELHEASAISPRATPLVSGAFLPGLGIRPSLPAGIMPSAVVVGDFNKDGKLDWAVANAGDSTLYIYLGNGDGTAKLPTIIPLSGKSPVGLAAGDLNGDGNLDLAVAEADSQTVGVLLGNGDGTFKPETLLPAFAVVTTAVAILDVNGDGASDLVVGLAGNYTTSVDSGFAVMLNDGTGNFGAPIFAPNSPATQYPSAQEFSVGDVNRDGHLDLLVTSVGNWFGVQGYGGRVQIFLGNGDGTFSAGQVLDASSEGGRVVQNAALADVNGDGCLDAVETDSLGNALIFPGDCHGDFSTTAASGALFYGMGDDPCGLAVADVNGDGHPDIITGGIGILLQDQLPQVGYAVGNMLGVRLNDGTGHFGPLRVYVGDPWMFSIAVADLSGTGLPDVVAANQDGDSATVYLNDGSGGFGPPSGGYDGEYEGSVNAYSNPAVTASMATDINGDGLPDLVLFENTDAFTNLFQLTVMLNQGNGQFGMPVRTPIFRSDYYVGDFAFGDFRNTGQRDLVGVAYDDSTSCGQPQLIYAPNIGGGSFGTPVQIPLTLPNSCYAFPILAIGDFNHDGKLDFAVVTPISGSSTAPFQITMYLGNGDGTFRAPNQMSFAPPSAVFDNSPVAFVEDANGDGNPDLLVWLANNVVGPGAPSMSLLEFLGNGDGTFQQPKAVIPNLYAMTMRDLNHDGLLDVINIHSGSPQAEDGPGSAPAEVSTYLGNPDGSFSLKSTISPFPGIFALDHADTADPSVPSDWSLRSYIGDFNGDGNTDIIVFQDIQWAGTPVYAQFLVGNGDGTFTPAYDIYAFTIPFIPDLVAENVFGDGRAAAMYAPNYAASYSILPTVVAPTIQADILETPVLSGQDTLQISLNVPSSSNTSVTLSASDPSVQIPSSATIPADTMEIGVPFTLAASFPPNQWFEITAQANGSTAVAYSYSPPQGGVDPFSMSIYGGFAPGTASSPAPGQDSVWIATVSASGNDSSTFQASCSGLPSGTSCYNFSPPAFNVPPAGSGATDFTITPPLNLAPGSYPFTASITDGYVTFSTPETLLVGDFTLGVTPSSVIAQATSSVNLNFNINYLFGYGQGPSLSCSGLPVGASCSFTSGFVLQLNQVAVGNYTFTVTATSNSLVHTATVQLQVISTPIITFNPSQFSIVPALVGGTSSQEIQLSNSGSAPLTISTIAVNGTGTAGTLSTSNTCGSTVSPGSNCTITVTFAATSVGTVSGTLTINDNAGDSPQVLPVTAQGVDFSLQAAPGGSTSATVNAGQSAVFLLEVAPNQFQGYVFLKCLTPPFYGSCTVDSGANVTGNSPATFQATVTTFAPTSQPASARSEARLWFVEVGIFGIVFGLAGAEEHRRSIRLRRKLRAVLYVVLLLGASTLLSCGGGSSGGGGGNSGTPPGTYTFTINGTAAGVTRTLSLKLTVN
jgi:hypothetical protein